MLELVGFYKSLLPVVGLEMLVGKARMKTSLVVDGVEREKNENMNKYQRK